MSNNENDSDTPLFDSEDSPEFKAAQKKKLLKAQKKWYAKLRKKGFSDLETFGANGEAQDLLRGKNSAHLRAKLPTMSETRHFYNLLTNFLTHNKWYMQRHKFEKYVARWYAAGQGHLQIIANGKNSKFLKSESSRFNLFTVHQTIKKFVTVARDWNRRHPEGLDYESDI